MGIEQLLRHSNNETKHIHIKEANIYNIYTSYTYLYITHHLHLIEVYLLQANTNKKRQQQKNVKTKRDSHVTSETLSS